VDGILSVYVLVHSQQALAARQTIISAAEMGDFWGWAEPPAQRVFQGITRLFNSGLNDRDIYAEAFRRIPLLIDGTDPDTSNIEESLTPLRRGIDLIDQRQISRKELGSHFAHYVVAASALADVDDERVAYVPDFNEMISAKAIFWPQVRAKWDSQRVCLVSIKRPAGWFHDLYCPGYLWADTEGLWRVPGLNFHDGMSSYDLDFPQLVDAFKELQRVETGAGQWCLGGTQLPFGTEVQSKFPLIARFLGSDGKPAFSQLPPFKVARSLADAF
jgi:hypothetical protein